MKQKLMVGWLGVVAALTMGCEREGVFTLSFEGGRITSSGSPLMNVLVDFIDTEGRHLPDVVHEIETLYGFRAEAVQYGVPYLTVGFSSSTCATRLEVLSADSTVTAWTTDLRQALNALDSLQVGLDVTGMPSMICGDVLSESDALDYRWQYHAMLPAYLEVTREVTIERLGRELKARVLGVNAMGESVVLDLLAGATEMDCVLDETRVYDDFHYYSSNKSWATFAWTQAAACSGKVAFRLDPALNAKKASDAAPLVPVKP